MSDRILAVFTEEDVRQVAGEYGMKLPDVISDDLWAEIVRNFNEALSWGDCLMVAINYAMEDAK